MSLRACNKWSIAKLITLQMRGTKWTSFFGGNTKEQMPYRRCKYARYWRQVNNLASHRQTPLLTDRHNLQHSQVSTFRGAPLTTAPFNYHKPIMRTILTLTSRNFYNIEHCLLPFLLLFLYIIVLDLCKC